MKLIRVAKLVRKDIFKTNYHFSGSLCDEQYNRLPTSLAALVRIFLCDSNTKQIIYDLEISRAATPQLLVFNAIKRSRADSEAERQNLYRETSSIVISACSSTTKHANGISLTFYLREDCQCHMTERCNSQWKKPIQ